MKIENQPFNTKKNSFEFFFIILFKRDMETSPERNVFIVY